MRQNGHITTPARLIFIVGFPRSGTTMLRNLLARSSRANAHLHEPHFIFDLHRKLGLESCVSTAYELLRRHSFTSDDDPWEVIRTNLPDRGRISLPDLFYAYFGGFFPDLGDKYLILKLPRFALHLAALERLFPGVRVVNVVRDPRGAVASHKIRWPSGTFLPRVAAWRRSIQAVGPWRNSVRFTEIRYEDLVLKPAEVLAEVCARTGLPFEESMCRPDYLLPQYDPARPGEMHMKHFSHFERQKLDAWQGILTPQELQLTQRLCRKEMESFGYTPVRVSVGRTAYGAFLLSQAVRFAYHAGRGLVTGG